MRDGLTALCFAIGESVLFDTGEEPVDGVDHFGDGIGVDDPLFEWVLCAVDGYDGGVGAVG